MGQNFREALQQRILVCDGAMGTMLQAAGMPGGHCSEEWNRSHPEVISGIHQAYLAAGADIIETNTFGGNRFRLGFHGFTKELAELNETAAQLARTVCPADKWVAGSVGPTGEFLEPSGSFTFDQFREAFLEQITALLLGGVDLIIVETMGDPQEGKAAIEAARSLDPNIPILSTMTFEKKPAGFRTMMGTQPAEMPAVYQEAGADVIGANCGSGMEEMISIVRILRENTDLPILAQANAGLPDTEEGRVIYRETPDDRAEAVERLLKTGVNIVGGCCGTTPAHIAATARIIKAYNHGR
jgi:5-methyltetrahydrofolate--homocysteine methyltransferase